jgi:hypothetical protein
MKHPAPEQWMSWLYHESTPAEKTHLENHLRSCEACQAKLKVWRASAAALDSWVVREKRPSRLARPTLKWAAAAAVVLALGFGLGRLSSPAAAQIDAARASMRQEMARQISTARTDTQQALAEIAAAYEDKRVEENQVVSDALRQLDARWGAKYASLRRELETVAVLTEDSLEDTKAQLVQLASYSQPTK